jgi:hypothetical protein
MIRNSIAKTAFIAAAVVASSAFAMQPGDAEAKVSINVFVAPNVIGPATRNAPPPRRNVAPVQRRNVAPVSRRMSCSQVRRVLRNSYGYRNIQAYDCNGKSYWFYAVKNGKRWRVKAASTTGQVIRRQRA